MIREPSVYLVGKQEIDVPELDLFLCSEARTPLWDTDTHRAGETLVEVAGRLCYMSFAKPRPGGNKAYIDHILEVGHGSVLEHAVFSLIITGVSRSLTHELVRHRAGMSYSQLSQRYVDESNVAFVLPPIMTAPTEEWFSARVADLAEYMAMASDIELTSNEDDRTLRRKQAREAARSVLPNCTETKIFVTGNARAWRHFLELRGSIHADAEMQRLARHMLRVLSESSPHLFGDYTITDKGITTPYRKV